MILFQNTDKKIERDKQKLLSELDNNGIDFLIESMNNDEIFSKHLVKRRKKESRSSDKISWYAFRKAETLNKDFEKKELIQKLDRTIDKLSRKHTYFALAHLCKNRTDISLFDYLMEKLETEKDESAKLSILIGISKMDKRKVSNIEPIKKLVNGHSRDLKVNSILSLHMTNDPDVEDLLLDIFENTNDSFYKDMVCSPLETIGTEKSISFLEKAYKKTRDYSLRNSIDRVLKSIKEK